jgi:glycosyltransferase involved in cell wall biosynthesis
MATTKAATKNSTSAFSTKRNKLRVGLVIPHIFMHQDILPHVIFSPGHLALSLADELRRQGIAVTLYTPGPVQTAAKNQTSDLGLFERELAGRGVQGDTYLDLLKKHPFTFITLARQVQSEIIAKAYADANNNKLDLVHIYANEEEIALPFAQLCRVPVVFSHHDPFNFLIKYKNNFPKYKHLNWISFSYAQRTGMPSDTNWVANIPHGLTNPALTPVAKPSGDYVAYLGRIIEPKGVHLAIQAVQIYNKTAKTPLTLRLAGKHYAEESKDAYWREKIEPALDDPHIFYDGFLDTDRMKRNFLANAKCLVVPSLFDEPFGMVTLEAFACGTPVIALDSGALPEIIDEAKTGRIVKKERNWNNKTDEQATVRRLAHALGNIDNIDRTACRLTYEARFSAKHMATEHIALYRRLLSADR